MFTKLMILNIKNIIAVYLLLVIGIYSTAQPSVYTNPLGIELVLIKPGSFIMGKFQPPFPKAPPSGSDAERGYHAEDYALAEKLATRDAMHGFNVTIQSSFYIGKYEVTQAQWKKVMGSNPSVFKADKVGDSTDEHPVDNVTWEAAQTFLRKLNAIDKEHIYRLPTEFEWEYAARAGAADDIPWSEIRLSAQMGMRTTQPVGKKKPNAWGLYDMLGNVWEWVQDYYNQKIFAGPVPPRAGKEHVLKGASFVGDVKNATYMTHAAGPGNKWDIGFRLVMEARKE